MTVGGILLNVGLVTNSLVSTATSGMTFIGDQPIILIPIVIGIAMMGFTVIKRFVKRV